MSTTDPRRRARAAALCCALALAWAASASGEEPAAPELLWSRHVGLDGRGATTGLLADLDGDGDPELVLHRGCRNGPSQVVVLDARDGAERWRAGFPGRSAVAALDTTGRSPGGGGADLVVASGSELLVLDGRSGRRVARAVLDAAFGDIAVCRLREGPGVVCTAGKGKRDDVLAVFGARDLDERWRLEAAEADGPFARGFTLPTALDVDGDGVDEILAAENGNHLLCLSAEGLLLWDAGLGRRERLRPEGVVSALPLTADLLGGGGRDVAVGCFAGALVLIDARTGEPMDRLLLGADAHERLLNDSRLPGFIRKALAGTGEPLNCLAAAELDGRPGAEVVAGCSDGHVYAVRPRTGDALWRFETLENVYDPPLLYDARGGPPLLLVWDSERVYLLDARSGRPAQSPLADALANAGGATSVLLTDGGGERELIHVPFEGDLVSAWALPGTTEVRENGEDR